MYLLTQTVGIRNQGQLLVVLLVGMFKRLQLFQTCDVSTVFENRARACL